MTTPQLLGLAEVAELYSISKNSANAWTRRHDFPAPVAKLAMGPVWSIDDVRAWRNPIVDHKQILQLACIYCGSKEFQGCDTVDGVTKALCGDCGMLTDVLITVCDRTMTVETSKEDL